MRIGEVLGLTWDDVDIVGKKIIVKRQVVYVKVLGNCLMEPKTPTSAREVLIDDVLADELRRWHARQLDNERERGQDLQKN